MDGILLVDKPVGISSFGVVSKIRWIIKDATGQRIKIGHTGTLDPLASGLMILVLGKYTKRAGEFSGMDKTYEAEITLGKISATGDAEGPITEYSQIPNTNSQIPSQSDIEAVLKAFEGKISQMPPAHSAKKIDGQRAYKLARAGKEVKLQPKEVTIYELRITNYEYPKVKFIAQVSSGTYIRSLAEDVGEKLGTGAYLSALRRTSVGKYELKDSVQLENLDLHHLIAHLKTGVVK